MLILPAMTAQLPGLALDTTTAFIPVVNVALAFRGLLVGEVMRCRSRSAPSSSSSWLAAIWLSVRLRSNEKVAPRSPSAASLGSRPAT